MKAPQRPWGAVPIDVLLDDRVSHSALKVYAALASFQGHSDACYPSREQISERCGLSLRVITKATNDLESAGWIEKVTRHSKNAPNLYRVNSSFDESSIVTPEVTFEGTKVTPVVTIESDPSGNFPLYENNTIKTTHTSGEEVLDYVNKTLSRKFKWDNKETASLITEALKSYSVNELKALVDYVAKKWEQRLWFPKSIFGGDKLDMKVTRAMDAKVPAAPKLKSVYDYIEEHR